MSGKKIIFIVLAFTIIALILTWLFLEYVIDEYDIDRAMNTYNIVKNTLNLSNSIIT